MKNKKKQLLLLCKKVCALIQLQRFWSKGSLVDVIFTVVHLGFDADETEKKNHFYLWDLERDIWTETVEIGCLCLPDPSI